MGFLPGGGGDSTGWADGKRDIEEEKLSSLFLSPFFNPDSYFFFSLLS
jgi:hypothetical protein